MSQLSQTQRDLLAEIGRFHMMLESPSRRRYVLVQNAARFCREQLRQLRQRLAEAEQAALSAQQSS